MFLQEKWDGLLEEEEPLSGQSRNHASKSILSIETDLFDMQFCGLCSGNIKVPIYILLLFAR